MCRSGRQLALPTTQRYVYDFISAEESALDDKEKATNLREWKEHQQLYEQLAMNFIENIEANPELKLIRSNPILPEIGYCCFCVSVIYFKTFTGFTKLLQNIFCQSFYF